MYVVLFFGIDVVSDVVLGLFFMEKEIIWKLWMIVEFSNGIIWDFGLCIWIGLKYMKIFFRVMGNVSDLWFMGVLGSVLC